MYRTLAGSTSNDSLPSVYNAAWSYTTSFQSSFKRQRANKFLYQELVWSLNYLDICTLSDVLHCRFQALAVSRKLPKFIRQPHHTYYLSQIPAALLYHLRPFARPWCIWIGRCRLGDLMRIIEKSIAAVALLSTMSSSPGHLTSKPQSPYQRWNPSTYPLSNGHERPLLANNSSKTCESICSKVLNIQTRGMLECWNVGVFKGL